MGQIGQFDTDTAALVKRIDAHNRFGKNDLNHWIFEQAKVRQGLAVLDLGCGTGKQSIPLAQRGCTVTAVDASADALAMLQGQQNIVTVRCDLDEVPRQVRGRFDRCISAYAIYYAKQPKALFEFIHSSLPPGGSLFFCGPASDNNEQMKTFLTSIGQTFALGAAPFMEQTGQSIARSLFSDVQTSSFENPLDFDSPESMWTYWSSHNMFDASVEGRFRAKAEQHFRDRGGFRTVKRVRGVFATK